MSTGASGEINGVLHPRLGAHDNRSRVANLRRCGRDRLTDELVNTRVGNGCFPLEHDFVQIRLSGEPVASTLEPHVPERALERVPHVLNLAARQARATNTEQKLCRGRAVHLVGAKRVKERRCR